MTHFSRADEEQVLITVTAMEEARTKTDAAQILRIVREESVLKLRQRSNLNSI